MIREIISTDILQVPHYCLSLKKNNKKKDKKRNELNIAAFYLSNYPERVDCKFHYLISMIRNFSQTLNVYPGTCTWNFISLCP